MKENLNNETTKQWKKTYVWSEYNRIYNAIRFRNGKRPDHVFDKCERESHVIQWTEKDVNSFVPRQDAILLYKVFLTVQNNCSFSKLQFIWPNICYFYTKLFNVVLTEYRTCFDETKV